MKSNKYNYVKYFNDPFVCVYDNVLNDDECLHFINLSKNKLKRALVSNEKSGYVSKGRTGSNTWINHNHDKITQDVSKRIANIVGLPLENAESFQIIHYNVNQEYRLHYDSWEQNGSEKTLRCMRLGGARIKTALCYLNNVKQGGGTKLTKLNKIIKSKKGSMLVFDNTYKNSNKRHPLSEHAGMPVLKGEKYAFNLWFRECNSKKLYSEHNPLYYKNLNIKIDRPIDIQIDEPIDEPTCKRMFIYRKDKAT